MTTFYVIRSGWNAANQSASHTCRNPQNKFESNQWRVVGVIEANDADAAMEAIDVVCYSGQNLFAVKNRRALKGLTAAVKQFFAPCYDFSFLDYEESRRSSAFFGT